MKQLALFKKRINRFENALLSAIEHFRKGEDHLGLDNFLNMVDDLEIIIDLHPYCEELKEKIDILVLVFQTLYLCIQNQDVVGLTDILEFKLYPLTKEWAWECDGI
jgi:hypothetical protein